MARVSRKELVSYVFGSRVLELMSAVEDVIYQYRQNDNRCSVDALRRLVHVLHTRTEQLEALTKDVCNGHKTQEELKELRMFETLGEQLKNHRTLAMLSQAKVAAAAGIPQTNYVAAEHDRYQLTPEQIQAVAKVLRCELEYVLVPENSVGTGLLNLHGTRSERENHERR